MPKSGSLREPLKFAAVATFIASLLNTFGLYLIVFPEKTMSWLVSPSLKDIHVGILILGALFFLYSFFSMLISVPVDSAIFLILLKICGARGDFRETLHVFCYYTAVSIIISPVFFISILLISAAYAAKMEGAVSTLLLVLGTLFVLIIVAYSLYVLFIGLSSVHEISIKRVALAIIGIPAGVAILFTVFILALVFISGFSSSTGGVPPSYNLSGNLDQSSVEGIKSNITAPYGTAPVIDGYYTSGDKWDEAQPIVFTSQGVNYTVAAKHDGLMLYILLMWKSGPEWENSISIYFEQDENSHDHDLRTGLNDEKYNGAIIYGPSGFYDAHFEGGVTETEDGMVRGNYKDGLWVQEWAVPLRSGDPKDISVNEFPATLGFAIIPWDRNGSTWPKYARAYQPASWGDLEILP